MQYIEDDRVPFAYTVGLTRDDLPEFLVTGVSPQRALTLLSGAARQAVDSDPFDGPFRALQLVWADRRGRWPWAADFDDGRGTQPVLGLRVGNDSEQSG